MRRFVRRGLQVLATLAIALILGIGALVIAFRHALPTVVRGPGAEDLARTVMQSVNARAWERTGAVQFTFDGRHRYLWDKRRNLVRFRDRDVEVLLDVDRASGRAYRSGVEVTSAEKAKLVDKALRSFWNDGFWLNPIVKLFDPGTERGVAKVDGTQALLVKYTSGGATPGDSYLWLIGPDHRPTAVRMFVRVIPIAGVEVTWGGWQTLATGAVVATEHRFPLGHTLSLSDIVGASTLEELAPGPDPFAALDARP